VPVGVGYGTDLDEFEALLADIAAEEPLVLDTPKPRSRFRSFGDSALQYELLCWVNSPTREAKARHELNRTLYQRLTAAGIEIPFPKRDVSVSGAGVADLPDGVRPAVPTDTGESPGVEPASEATDGGSDAPPEESAPDAEAGAERE
jgi:small-conductance mechanosensitive channel